MPMDIDTLYNALIGLESGGRHSAVNSRSGARGISQIMPANWNPWSEETFGKVVPQTEYAQRLVTKKKLQEYWDSFGSPQAALAAWFAGPDDGRGYANRDPSTLRKSDGNMTVEQYVNTIWNRAVEMAGGDAETQSGSYSQSGPNNIYDAEQKLQIWLNELSHGVAGGRRESPENVIVRNFVEATDLGRNVDEPEEVAVEQGQDPNEEPILGFVDPTEDLWDFGQNEAARANQPVDMASPASQALINVGEDGNQDLSALIEAKSQPGDLGLPDNIFDSDFDSSNASGDGQEAVDIATQFLGVPYKWGGESPRGFDCSGLLQYVFNKMGVKLPRVSRDQARAGRAVRSLSEAQPGDLVAFAKSGRPVHHIGMYVGGGKMLHAPQTGDVVKISDISGRGIAAIRRVI